MLRPNSRYHLSRIGPSEQRGELQTARGQASRVELPGRPGGASQRPTSTENRELPTALSLILCPVFHGSPPRLELVRVEGLDAVLPLTVTAVASSPESIVQLREALACQTASLSGRGS